MRIAVWRTGHEIADKITESVAHGLQTKSKMVNGDCSQLEQFDAHIAYGILRGTSDIFRWCQENQKPWFNIDRGYLKPGHYHGYYRVSLRGTQHTGGIKEWMLDQSRLNGYAINCPLDPWIGFRPDKPVLICPPTGYVKGFFKDIDDDKWLDRAFKFLEANGITNWKVRTKDEDPKTSLPDVANSNFVYTFNCSLGWKAIGMGIPCLSDPDHSFVGSCFHNISLDKLSHAQDIARQKIFCAMSNLQLTLEEIKAGLLWPLLNRLLST